MSTTPRRRYRLGLDLGSNSLGWWVVWLGRDRPTDAGMPVGIGPGGVRIFDDGRDPQSGTSNASDRRLARGARVRRDRFVRRKRGLMQALIAHGLMPGDEAARKALEGVDPYRLRAEALDGKLPLSHIGRALFHLNQRRGFQSNRKADKVGDEKGAIKEATRKLADAMAEEDAATYGVWLWRRQQKREGVRAKATITGTNLMETFRPLVDREVHRLVAESALEVTPDAKAALARVMIADLAAQEGLSPLFLCLERLAASLAREFAGEGERLALPRPALSLGF